MSYTDNRTLLEKADMAIRDLQEGGGYLLPAQAQRFMRLLIKQSALMEMATVIPMAVTPKQQLAKIKFGRRVLRAGKEATRLSDAERAKPDFAYTELDAKLFKAEVDLDDEVLEDSVERGELRQTIMELLAERIGLDMEEAVIMGDTTSSGPLPGAARRGLAQTVSHVVDAGATSDQGRACSGHAARAAKRIPEGQKESLVPHERRHRARIPQHVGGARDRAGGDKWIETDVPVMYSGIPIRPIPLFRSTCPRLCSCRRPRARCRRRPSGHPPSRPCRRTAPRSLLATSATLAQDGGAFESRRGGTSPRACCGWSRH